MTKLLIYAQDPGGAQNVALATRYLLKRIPIDCAIVLHPLAVDSFREFRLPFELLSEKVAHLPLDEKQAGDFLSERAFTHVFCGTSNARYDPTNSNIIKAARALSMPSLGFLEHWKGWDRFSDSAGGLTYLPDLLGCIDDFSAAKLAEMGAAKHGLAVVGHPYLEWLAERSQAGDFRRKDGMVKQVVIVSQPVADRGFESMLAFPIDSVPLAGRLAMTFDELRRSFDFAVRYRPHPKEKGTVNLPDGIARDGGGRWIDVLKDVDVVVGLDSMAMIEAFFAGKTCISLAFPALRNLSDTSCPFAFSRNVSSTEELKTVLALALAVEREQFPSAEGPRASMKGSGERLAMAVLDFVNANRRR